MVNGLNDVTGKFQICCDKLLAWNRSEFGHVQTSIRSKKAELEQLLEDCAVMNTRDRITSCLDSISSLEKFEEVF